MTIRKIGDTFTVECDECGDEVEFDEGETFEQVTTAIHNDGWRLKRVGRWINICPDCLP